MNIFNIAETFLSIKGQPFRGIDYPLLKPFYSSSANKKIIKGARQIAKSTSLAVIQSVKACIEPYTLILTVFPLQSQTRNFSTIYVDSLIRDNDILYTRAGKNKKNNVYRKMFKNGSILFYNYLGNDPSRIRGLSVNNFYVDELQDHFSDSISIAEHCTDSFINAKFCYTGTPLTTDNIIESFWRESSQFESFVPCPSCNFRNFCLKPQVFSMLKPQGLMCQNCGKQLIQQDLYNASFESYNPTQVGIYDGWHIPQIFMPFNLNRWNAIYNAYITKSEFEFCTEILGISCDVGGKPVSLSTLQECELPVTDKFYKLKVMGVDWGGGSANSLTVITVLGITPENTYDVLYSFKFPTRSRMEQLNEILSLFSKYKCNAIGADSGVGLTDNQLLKHHLSPQKVFVFKYGNPAQILKFLPDIGEYSTNRSKTLSIMFRDLNMRKISFPPNYREFFNDILNIYEEIRPSIHGEHRVYDHAPCNPDDFAHALNFALITAKLLTSPSIFN